MNYHPAMPSIQNFLYRMKKQNAHKILIDIIHRHRNTAHQNDHTLAQLINYKDEVTGLVGVVNARCEHLNGCHRYSVQPPVSKKNRAEMPEGYWIDEQQLTVFKKKKLKSKVVRQTKTGGFSDRTGF